MDLFRKKGIEDVNHSGGDLKRCLTAVDLTLLGIGAIIGAGIFVLTGFVAATKAGPAIMLSYVVAGFACAFSALSYAELASSIGGCGSAYGYAYAGFGEIFAWIVGWDLLLEYAIGVSTVSVGWSSYFRDLISVFNIQIPSRWIVGPFQGGIVDILAILIIFFLSILQIKGVKISAYVNNLMVCIKLFVLIIFIAIALGAINPKNWVPFTPFGWVGVIKGAALIFFAYIGFDAVSTASEEAIHPQRDLPIGILGSLLICTTLYIIVSALLTGMAKYNTLNNASPISNTLLVLGYHFAATLVSVGAVAGLTTVMLVLFYGLTRVFLAMARDGLLPGFFASINGKTQTPVRIIVLCGFLMGATGATIPIDTLAELVNIGTLVAFMIVCSGVLILRFTAPELSRPFKTPWMPYTPIAGVLTCLYLIIHLPWMTLLRFIIWMAIGLIIYFAFSYKNSKLINN